MAVLIVAAFAAGPVLADCPAAPDHSKELDGLIAHAQVARSELIARTAAEKMWELWTDAPDEIAQSMLDQGMAMRRSYDFLGALNVLNRLVEYCPEYAEGYNQRAFVNFLRQDFTPALGDLDRAIELSPNHIAALSGRALTLMGLGRNEEARQALKQALELNPWLSERSLLAPGGPLEPEGQDL